jgi:uncharacterized protein (TIGR03067 family)
MSIRLLTLAAALIVLGAGPADEASRKDLEKLQGDWAEVSVTIDGSKLSDDEAQSIFRTVKGNEYTVFLFRKALAKGTFVIDATKKPKTIDAVPSNAKSKKPLLGIYELDGDRWTMCFAGAGKDRPTGFASTEGSGNSLSIWEREKR